MRGGMRCPAQATATISSVTPGIDDQQVPGLQAAFDEVSIVILPRNDMWVLLFLGGTPRGDFPAGSTSKPSKSGTPKKELC